MKILISLLILLGTFSVLESQSRLTVKASEGFDFILTVNDITANNAPCLSITLDKITSGKTAIKATIPSHPEIIITQVIMLKKNSTTTYEIEKSKGVYKLMLRSETSLTSSTAAPTSAKNVQTDTLEVNDLEIIGPEGCTTVVDQDTYDAMLKEVSDNFFESRKLEVMKAFVKQRCVLVEQLRFMLSKLSLEENKFDLLQVGIKSVHDPIHLKRMEEDFFLEKNKARVHKLIAEHS